MPPLTQYISLFLNSCQNGTSLYCAYCNSTQQFTFMPTVHTGSYRMVSSRPPMFKGLPFFWFVPEYACTRYVFWAAHGNRPKYRWYNDKGLPIVVNCLHAVTVFLHAHSNLQSTIPMLEASEAPPSGIHSPNDKHPFSHRPSHTHSPTAPPPHTFSTVLTPIGVIT